MCAAGALLQADDATRSFPGAEGWTKTVGGRDGKILPQPAQIFWPERLKPLPAARVQKHVLRDAGARPWNPDGSTRVIDNETQGGGYPPVKETHLPFKSDEWDPNTMERRDAAAK
jgi:hypothetical protein